MRVFLGPDCGADGKYLWYGMLTLWGWGGDEEYSRARGGDWDSSFYCGAL